MSGLVGVSVVACALGNQYYAVSNTVYYAPTTVERLQHVSSILDTLESLDDTLQSETRAEIWRRVYDIYIELHNDSLTKHILTDTHRARIAADLRHVTSIIAEDAKKILTHTRRMVGTSSGIQLNTTRLTRSVSYIITAFI